jgi:hypothetical protein
MKAQPPAEGILKTNDFGDSKWYHVVCGCGQPDHALTVEVESDDMGVNVNTYATVKTDYWTDNVKKRYDIDNPWLQEFDWFWKDLVNGIIIRLKLTWTVWTNGYVQAETTISMSEQQALNYAETLKSAINDVKMFKTDIKEKSVTGKLAEQGDCI